MANKMKRKDTYRSKWRQDQSKAQGFFAFPSLPEDRVRIIEKAISTINKEDTIKITSWKDMAKNSSRIISNILEGIDKADFFIGDISGLNPNVLFEAGYAFGSRKRTILISQGCSTQKFHQDINDLQILSGWEIIRYENVNQLASVIAKKDFSNKNYVPEFDKYLSLRDQLTDPNRGLFLKASCKHQIATSALSTFRTMFDTIVDDWDENKSQPLHWYIKAVCQSTIILSLFIPSEYDNSRAMNARFSFICGMAVALNKHVRLIGLPGYITPVDYQEMMIHPANDEQIRVFLDNDLIISKKEGIATNQQLNNPPRAEDGLNRNTKEIIFLKINLGDSIAENEEHELNNYFIQTGKYVEAIHRRQAIIVGNKGTGKTAMFYQLRSHFQRDVRNVVCEIKPSDYKMTRFLQALSELPEGRVEHVLESVWKLVIYCEIISSIYQKLQKRTPEAGFSQKEEVIIRYYQMHESLIVSPFEQKLETATDWLEDVALDSDNFSKKIHDLFLIECKDVLSSAMKDVNKTVILVDNLDKSWKVDTNLDQQAQLVLALLGIHRRISTEIGKNSNVSIMIFLRRNIFEYILESKIVRESDKLLLDHIELEWNDPEMLLRVIERRFWRALKDLQIDNETDNIWSEFFIEDVEGNQIRKWLYANVLHRPRDLIHFVQKAIGYAINRDHGKILGADLASAAESYPGFALEQIVSEYRAEQPWLQVAILSFRGKSDIWGFRPLITHLETYLQNYLDIHEIDVRKIVADLVGIGFIGIQASEKKTEYADTVSKSRELRVIVMNHPIDQPIRLVIHPVFYLYLNIIEKQGALEYTRSVPKNEDIRNLEEQQQRFEATKRGHTKTTGKKGSDEIPIVYSKSVLALFRTLWKDPVWSKVIATGIVAILGVLFGNSILTFVQKSLRL